MARIRTIKPDFFTSLTIADLTHEARLTFIGLWTHVDDEGRCVDDARLVKAAVWPLDERTAKDVDIDLWEISDAGLVRRYTVGVKKFIAVTSWKEHQRINRPTASKFPPPEEGEPTPKPRLTEDSVRAHGGLSEGSRGDHTAPHEHSFTPAREGEMSEFTDQPSTHSKSCSESVVLPMFTSENITPECTHGGLSEDSVRPHWRKGTGNREQGRDLYSASALSSPDGEAQNPPSSMTFDGYQDPRFKKFWERYPKKVSKKKACTAFERALRRTSFDALMSGLENYLTQDSRFLSGYVKDPTTWLNGDCWDDEPVRPANPQTVVGGSLSEVPDHTYWQNITEEELRNIL